VLRNCVSRWQQCSTLSNRDHSYERPIRPRSVEIVQSMIGGCEVNHTWKRGELAHLRSEGGPVQANRGITTCPHQVGAKLREQTRTALLVAVDQEHVMAGSSPTEIAF
jgi:hypothetical protein